MPKRATVNFGRPPWATFLDVTDNLQVRLTTKSETHQRHVSLRHPLVLRGLRRRSVRIGSLARAHDGLDFGGVRDANPVHLRRWRQIRKTNAQPNKTP